MPKCTGTADYLPSRVAAAVLGQSSVPLVRTCRWRFRRDLKRFRCGARSLEFGHILQALRMYIRVCLALLAGLGDGEGNAACILRGRVNARDLLLFRREDRLCKGRKATCRTRRSHMHFGSPPKCTWPRFFLAANARVCCSFEARRGCGRPEKHPPCILAERLNARGLRLPSYCDLGTHKPLRHQPERMRFGSDSKCIWSRALGFGSMRPRLGHAQTASSQPSRMHFGTNSKCIRSPCSGLGV